MRTVSLLALLSVVPATMAALRGTYGSAKSFAAMCNKPASSAATKDELQQIAYATRDEINALVDPMSDSEKANLFATAFKLIFHDAAEADLRSNDQLGSDGCLSYTEANEDLVSSTSIVNTVIEPMWQKYCDKMTRADFWVLFAKLALEKADGSHSLNLPFQYGRKDAKECAVSSSRLMDNQRGEDDFFRVYLQQMQLSVNDAVVLMGARSVGYHTGGEYSWDESPSVLDNGYFQLLSKSSWKDVVVGTKNHWIQVQPISAPVQEVSAASASTLTATDASAPVDTTNTESSSVLGTIAEFITRRRTQEEVATVPIANPSDFVPVKSAVAMLNTDMSLAFPIHTEFSFYYRSYVSREDDMCGPTMVTGGTEHGCVGGGEETVGWPYYTFNQVQRYAESNSAFMWDFTGAFWRMTAVGYNGAGRVIEEGKFGTLTQMPTISNAM